MNLSSALQEIRFSDPDGRPWEPTDAERREFMLWVIDKYGQDVWDTYYTTGWDTL